MFNAMKVKNDVVRWIRDFFEEDVNAGSGAVIGISGGKDSAVTAALCAEAIGVDRVTGVLMPQGMQHDIDVSLKVVGLLGIRHYVVNIAESVDAILAAISSSGAELNRQAKINTPARIRMTTLYAVAAAVNGRVVNTCNMSEDWVGYSTKFGDSAGDLSPLAQLTVTEVKAIGKVLGLPENIVNKTPEDGLSGLSDEENLGFTYDVLDRYIREGICDDLTTKGKIDALHKKNLHKMRFMPCFEFAPG